MIVLIPAYKPDMPLVALADSFMREQAKILIVDDGSGAEYAPIFEQARGCGANALGYDINRGKGYALRYGFEWCAAHAPEEYVVTADADGQHTCEDILRVGNAAQDNPDSLILGMRTTHGLRAKNNGVPLKSRFGGAVSSWALRLAGRVNISDTQTGLRGFSPALVRDMTGIAGERYEYELNMLLLPQSAVFRFVKCRFRRFTSMEIRGLISG